MFPSEFVKKIKSLESLLFLVSCTTLPSIPWDQRWCSNLPLKLPPRWHPKNSIIVGKLTVSITAIKSNEMKCFVLYDKIQYTKSVHWNWKKNISSGYQPKDTSSTTVKITWKRFVNFRQDIFTDVRVNESLLHTTYIYLWSWRWEKVHSS